MIFVDSLSLFLCLHLAINSHRWFTNFSGSGYIIICIFSSRHRLHLLSKHFGVFDFFNMDHWISAVKPLFFKLQKCLVLSNNKIVNFLVVTQDLSNNTYKHFLKTDQYPSYINVNSNHPKTIIKQVPKAVKLRISNFSANEKIFQESRKIYTDAP